MGVVKMNVMSNGTDLIRTELLLEPRHAVGRTVGNDPDMIGKHIDIE